MGENREEPAAKPVVDQERLETLRKRNRFPIYESFLRGFALSSVLIGAVATGTGIVKEGTAASPYPTLDFSSAVTIDPNDNSIVVNAREIQSIEDKYVSKLENYKQDKSEADAFFLGGLGSTLVSVAVTGPVLLGESEKVGNRRRTRLKFIADNEQPPSPVPAKA